MKTTRQRRISTAMIGWAALVFADDKGGKSSGRWQGEPDGGKFAKAVERQQHSPGRISACRHDVSDRLPGAAMHLSRQQQQRRERDNRNQNTANPRWRSARRRAGARHQPNAIIIV